MRETLKAEIESLTSEWLASAYTKQTTGPVLHAVRKGQSPAQDGVLVKHGTVNLLNDVIPETRN